jgi:hypothetical protein
VIGTRHSIAGETGREGASRSKNVLEKELQTTITDSITCDGMGQDKTMHVNGKTVCYNLRFDNPL